MLPASQIPVSLSCLQGHTEPFAPFCPQISAFSIPRGPLSSSGLPRLIPVAEWSRRREQGEKEEEEKP